MAFKQLRNPDRQPFNAIVQYIVLEERWVLLKGVCLVAPVGFV